MAYKTTIAKDKLRQVLDDNNIMRKEVAYSIGITPRTMSNVLGKKSCRLITAEKIAWFLKMDQDELFETKEV